MRALLITLGSHGDIHPFIAIGRALARRGVDAAILTNSWFAPAIRRAGLELIAAGEEPMDVGQFMLDNPWMNNPRTAGKRLFRDVILPVVGELLDRADAEIASRRPSFIVVHPLALGIPSLCHARAIPWVSASLAPMTWLSREEVVHAMPLPLLGLDQPLWLWRALRILSLASMRRWIDAGVNRHLAARGLPTHSSHFPTGARGHADDPYAPRSALSLGLWSPAFRPARADDPPNAVIAGFPWFDQPDQPDEDHELVERFLDAGPPPIVFTLGTATVHTPGKFYLHATDVCRQLGRRAILLTGRGNPAPPSLPPETIAIPYAPFSTLLPRAAATVHHGGIGTTAQGLRSGRPTVIVPYSHDQYDNAARAQALGASVTSLDRSPRALARVLDRILSVPSYARAAAAVAPSMAADGAEAAADHLLRL